VRSRAEDKVDHIKVFMTGGMSSPGGALMDSQYSQSEIAAVVEEAAEHGLKVSAHAHGGPGVGFAVAAGIHSIEHGVMLSAEDARAMAERGVRLVLTTTILHHPDGLERGDGADPAIMAKIRQGREVSARTAAVVRESGIEIAVGTDSMHGMFGYELSWLVGHGWSPREALVAATSGGAALLERDDIGVLRHGSRADFIVLASDPLDDIAAVHDVDAVYQDGRHVA